MPCSENHATCPERSEWIPILDELRMREEQSSVSGSPVENPPNERGAAGQSISDPLCPSVAKKGRGWGGRRPGAGAPKGNLNALKHGRYSRRQVRLLEALVEIPEARDALIEISRRNRRLREQAEEGAGVLMTRLLERVAQMVLNQEHDQDQDNQEFLGFLNTVTAQMRIFLEKRSRLRRAPIKPVLSRSRRRVEGRRPAPEP